MTVIGVLTFVFFPGTFLASIFTMPLINWNPDKSKGEKKLHDQFYLFPVVTIAFTAAILLLFWPGIWIMNGITRAEKETKKTDSNDA